MSLPHFLRVLGLLLVLAVLTLAARADEGHDHGDKPATAASAALPRFTAVSESFELVGVLDGKRLTLYLDHAADNRPVKGAKLELEVGGTKLAVQPDGSDGEFEAVLPTAPKPGVIAVTATVVAGNESDLLAGELDIHEDAQHAPATKPAWKIYGAWAAGVAAVLALATFGVMRWRRPPRVGQGVELAVALMIIALATSTPTWAGEGHDHGDAPPAANSNGPRRLPDGSVFLPKPAQRQLVVRTLPVEDAELPKAVELAGKVVMDPNAGGRVQAALAGRLEPGPRGFPGIGQAVRQGEVLAYVLPSSGALERSGQLAQLAELRAAKLLADKRVTRLKELADTVPRKDIDAAESEAQGLVERITALGSGLVTRDALVAPASGVIASSHAVAGQVVEARELVFEVVNPARLRIEALAYDAAQAADVAGASLALGSQKLPLAYLGAARSLREQALPMQFALGSGSSAALPLAVGQAVRVIVQSRSRIKGLAVPSAALMKNPSNQTIVWVKQAPERFEPRVVTFEPLDGASVAITSGLKAGDRVATQGATLINQVR